MECYICDKSFRNKKMLEQHVEKCLDEATQMQHEIETRGMDSILEPGEISPRKRATRSARTTEPNEGYSSGSKYSNFKRWWFTINCQLSEIFQKNNIRGDSSHLKKWGVGSNYMSPFKCIDRPKKWGVPTPGSTTEHTW